MTVGELIKELEKLDPASKIEVETALRWGNPARATRWRIDQIGPYEGVWGDEENYPAGLHAIYVS